MFYKNALSFAKYTPPLRLAVACLSAKLEVPNRTRVLLHCLHHMVNLHNLTAFEIASILISWHTCFVHLAINLSQSTKTLAELEMRLVNTSTITVHEFTGTDDPH